MKRAGRWLFNLAAGVSAVLCVAIMALAMRSYWAASMLTWENGNFGSHQRPVFITERQILWTSGKFTLVSVYAELQGSGAGPTRTRRSKQRVAGERLRALYEPRNGNLLREMTKDK